MRIYDFLKYKISVHHNSNTKNIIKNNYYFEFILKEFNLLEDVKYYDFSMYAYDKIDLDKNNPETYLEYKIEQDKKHKDFNNEIMNNTIQDKYYIQNYKNIPIIKHTDNIFKRYDILEDDIINNNVDRYREVDSFISFLKSEFLKISLNKIHLDIISSLLNKENNYSLSACEILGKTKPDENIYIIWDSFKKLLDEQLRLLYTSIKNNVENYKPSEDVPKIQNRINALLIDSNIFYQWDEIFEDKFMYDKFIETFTNYAMKKEYDKKFNIVTKKRIKTNLSKVLRLIYREISDKQLKTDYEYLELLKQIDIYKDFNFDQIYELLNKN